MDSLNKSWYLAGSSGKHRVEVCPDDTSQVEQLTRYLMEGFHNDEAMMVVAKPALRSAVMAQLSLLGLDVQSIKNQGQIRFFDAEFLISRFTIDGVLDEEFFQEYVGTHVEILRLRFGNVRIFGGMVALLWDQGKYHEAMQVEEFWCNLLEQHEAKLLCSYSLSRVEPALFQESVDFICKCHNHLIPEEKGEVEVHTNHQEVMEMLKSAWENVMKNRVQTQTPPSTYPPPFSMN
ncbi:MAG TPA: MEDS domain-containing protein [Nitrosomonas sp.]|nr:MEDS domain-containing protein [Nitrosomonas sp.]